MFTSLKLKKENKKLFVENKRLKKLIDAQRDNEIILQSEIASVKKELNQIENKLKKTKAEVRSQKGADLLLSTLKLLFLEIKGIELEREELDNHQLLYNQYMAMLPANRHPYYALSTNLGSSLFEGFGLK